MKNILVGLSILLFVSSFNTYVYAQQESTLNPALELADEAVKGLDGAYSVISKDDDGNTTHINVKFKNGKLTSFVLNGQEIPEKNWKEHETLISEYVAYLSPDESKSYKHKEVYDLEHDLRKDLERIERTVKELEVSRRIEAFYNHELKDFMESLERHLDESEFI